MWTIVPKSQYFESIISSKLSSITLRFLHSGRLLVQSHSATEFPSWVVLLQRTIWNISWASTTFQKLLLWFQIFKTDFRFLNWYIDVLNLSVNENQNLQMMEALRNRKLSACNNLIFFPLPSFDEGLLIWNMNCIYFSTDAACPAECFRHIQLKFKL